MEEVQFTITEQEVRDLSSVPLTDAQVKQVLDTVENDQILWRKIDESLRAAIEITLEN